MKQIQIPYFGQTAKPQTSFFKRSLSATPMGVFNEGTGKGRIYVYDQRYGSTRSSHIISILDHFIADQWDGEDTLVINFDNCAVNKNFRVSIVEIFNFYFSFDFLIFSPFFRYSHTRTSSREMEFIQESYYTLSYCRTYHI